MRSPPASRAREDPQGAGRTWSYFGPSFSSGGNLHARGSMAFPRIKRARRHREIPTRRILPLRGGDAFKLDSTPALHRSAAPAVGCEESPMRRGRDAAERAPRAMRFFYAIRDAFCSGGQRVRCPGQCPGATGCAVKYSPFSISDLAVFPARTGCATGYWPACICPCAGAKAERGGRLRAGQSEAYRPTLASCANGIAAFGRRFAPAAGSSRRAPAVLPVRRTSGQRCHEGNDGVPCLRNPAFRGPCARMRSA